MTGGDDEGRSASPWRNVLAVAILAGAVLTAIAVGSRERGGDAAKPPARTRVVTTLVLAEALGELAPGFGSAWIADRSGAVLRVGTRFRQTRAEIAVGRRPALATGAGAVWVLAREDGPRLLKIDPATNRITARTRVEPPAGSLLLGVQVLRGAPWVIATGGALEADPRTGRGRRSVRFATGGAEPFSVGADDAALWVLTREQRLLRYDVATGRRSGELPMRLPGATVVLPSAAGPVLIDRGGKLARADPRDGRLAWQRAEGTSINAALVTGGALWVHVADAEGGSDRLFELDLRTGATRGVTPLPEFGAAGLARVGRELWITTPDGKLMVLRKSRTAG